uniref:EGF-like domain-containing protein n=1 Tax=Ciona intestinalis TaxID=7719 RepID=H2XZR9_CIOIN
MVGRFSFASDFSALTDGCYAPEVEGRNVKLLHGDEILPHYELDSELHFCCMPGYRAVSQLTIQCVDGRWTDQPECASLCRHRCLHSGSCVAHDKCSCVNGWSGNRCRHPTCILPCMNGGYCSAPYTCTCSPGWTGERCQTPFCTKSCQNGGQCVSPEQCKCPYGYFGEDCSEERSYFGLYW